MTGHMPRTNDSILGKARCFCGHGSTWKVSLPLWDRAKSRTAQLGRGMGCKQCRYAMQLLSKNFFASPLCDEVTFDVFMMLYQLVHCWWLQITCPLLSWWYWMHYLQSRRKKIIRYAKFTQANSCKFTGFSPYWGHLFLTSVFCFWILVIFPYQILVTDLHIWRGGGPKNSPNLSRLWREYSI